MMLQLRVIHTIITITQVNTDTHDRTTNSIDYRRVFTSNHRLEYLQKSQRREEDRQRAERRI